jgi:hypothetical protein
MDAVLPQPFTVAGEWWSTIQLSSPDYRCGHSHFVNLLEHENVRRTPIYALVGHLDLQTLLIIYPSICTIVEYRKLFLSWNLSQEFETLHAPQNINQSAVLTFILHQYCYASSVESFSLSYQLKLLVMTHQPHCMKFLVLWPELLINISIKKFSVTCFVVPLRFIASLVWIRAQSSVGRLRMRNKDDPLSDPRS